MIENAVALTRKRNRANLELAVSKPGPDKFRFAADMGGPNTEMESMVSLHRRLRPRYRASPAVPLKYKDAMLF